MLTPDANGDDAVVLAFPRVRHHSIVAKHASRMAELPPVTAEKYLARQLDVQRETMTRRGIAAASIDHELKALRSAIRAALWRIGSARPGGVAG